MRRLDEAPAGGARAILLLDGRVDPLAALSLAHRLAEQRPRPPLDLVPRGAGAAPSAVAGLGASQLAAMIEAPLSDGALASALLAAIAGDVPPAEIAPPREGPAARPPRTAAAGPPARKLKVLVADDNAANRKILQEHPRDGRPSDRGGQ